MVDWDALNGMMAEDENNPLALLAGSAGIDVFFVTAGALGASIVAAVLLYPLFAAIMLRWWISGLRFGALAVRSQLSTAQVYRIYLRFLVYVVPFFIVVAVVGSLCVVASSALVASNRDSVPAELFASAITLGIYVTLVLGASTIYQVAVTFAMWRLGVQTAELTGAETLDGVRAAGAPDSALGEGLVDALGVGGI
jgi:uncharacterized membrane protein YjgN (DUF898 family)